MPRLFKRTLKILTMPPRTLKNKINNFFWFRRGLNHDERANVLAESAVRQKNDLEKYFDAVKTGPGIWKWRHYFDIYDRHFSKFRGSKVNILEIGIYSGGSLSMWQKYFGSGCTIYGVDIEPDCRGYEREGIKVFIGDQSDRKFWKLFKSETPQMDIIIDDGGHKTNQQVVSFEELFSHLKPGGIYLCEDLQRRTNGFAAYVNGLANQLNDSNKASQKAFRESRPGISTTNIQKCIHSIQLYPFVAVIEKRLQPLEEMVSLKHGDQWQPFFE